MDPGTASAETAEDWWARILAEGSTSNGVWGGKIMWSKIEDFVARARELPVAYEYEAIDHLVSQLEADERSWSDWFARTGRKPIHVTYDRLDAAPGHTVEVVLHALGLPDSAVAVPRLTRQRDDLSAAWIERYRQERGRAA